MIKKNIHFKNLVFLSGAMILISSLSVQAMDGTDLPDSHGRIPGALNYRNPKMDSELMPDSHGRIPGALNYGNPKMDPELNNIQH